MSQLRLSEWADTRHLKKACPQNARSRPKKGRPAPLREHLAELLGRGWWSLPELADELRKVHGIQAMQTGIHATIAKLRKLGVFVSARRRKGNLWEYSISGRVSPGKADDGRR
jgi:biotin operon repressor